MYVAMPDLIIDNAKSRLARRSMSGEFTAALWISCSAIVFSKGIIYRKVLDGPRDQTRAERSVHHNIPRAQTANRRKPSAAGPTL